LIHLDDIHVRFPGRGSAEVHAVRGVSLHVGDGDLFGIVGTSGAGKSTLLRTINLLERPSAGRVVVGGQDLGQLGPEPLRQARLRIGMIFQHYNLLFSRSVFENVAFPLRIAGVAEAEIRRRVEELLELVELADKRDAYPARLSGGQKQRVGIARALANRPRVLLCDEPTSSLDLETSAAILDLLRSVHARGGLTVVLISHELHVIKRVCNRVAVMKDGEVVESGEVLELFARPQAAFTAELVARSQDLALPERVRMGQPGAIVTLHYRGERAEEPVIAETLRRFPVVINILHGRIEYIGGEPLATLVVRLQGEPGAQQQALEFLRASVARLEVVDAA
jgi:D-methionine transport system ATP-binding protein